MFQAGGDVALEAGNAFYTGHWNTMYTRPGSMSGGNVRISGGTTDGQSDKDTGGSLSFFAGDSKGSGGSIDVTSGGSHDQSSE